MPECVVPGVITRRVNVEPPNIEVNVSVKVLVTPGWLLLGVCSVLTRVSKAKMWNGNYNHLGTHYSLGLYPPIIYLHVLHTARCSYSLLCWLGTYRNMEHGGL